MFALHREANNGTSNDGLPIADFTPEHNVTSSLHDIDSKSSLDGARLKATSGQHTFGLGLYGADVASGQLLAQDGESKHTSFGRDGLGADAHDVNERLGAEYQKFGVRMEQQSQLPTPSHDSELSHSGFDNPNEAAIQINGDTREAAGPTSASSLKVEDVLIAPEMMNTLPGQTPQKRRQHSEATRLATPETIRTASNASPGARAAVSPRKSDAEFRARSSLPSNLPPHELARQCFLAAYSSRLNPTALHPGEYRLLKDHITLAQVAIYLNIRNAILRLWTRNPLVGVREDEAAGCARDSRYFQLALLAREWLMRQGYINFGCVDVAKTAGTVPKSKGGRRPTIAVVGAGMSGLGCARHLEGLISQLGHHWTARGEKTPTVKVFEGRGRVGGRVYSYELKTQHEGTLPPGLRSTAEMGAQIVTGFEHGNPMNVIIRGQLGLHTYALKDNSILYDHDGSIVGKERDSRVEQLYNDVLERASVFRNLAQPPVTVEADRGMLSLGKELPDDGGPTISQLERDGTLQTDSSSLDRAKIEGPRQAAISTEKLTGRAYQIAGLSSRIPAAEAAAKMGWTLRDGTTLQDTIILTPPNDDLSDPGTLGDTMDEGIEQYKNLLSLTPEDLRLLNWHHANLEYANSANVNQLSLTGWDQDLGNEFEGEHTEVVGGYSQVPRALLQCPFPLEVQSNTKVVKVRHSETQVSLESEGGETWDADRVIVTTPLGVLKSGSLQFSPALPEWKVGAIERLGFGLLNKVVLVYERPFWEESRDMFGLLNDSITPGSLSQKDYSSRRGRFYLFWNIIKTSGRPTLVALMAGDAAHQAEQESSSTLVDDLTARLARMFPTQTVPLPIEAIITRWSEDPFSYGSYSYVGPKTRAGDYDVMAQPVGRVHFAGEATCGTHPATVHGAYLSGLRAAAEVIDAMLGPLTAPEGLIPPKTKVTNGTPSSASSKRRLSFVPLYDQKPEVADPLKAQAEAYEVAIINKIISELGERPWKPAKQGVNPFLLYQKDSWYACKAEMDAEVQRKTGKPGAKASKTDVRVALGSRWRNASEEVRKPYLDAAQASKDGVAALTAEYAEKVKKWDEAAVEIREEYIATNPLPDGSEKQHSWRTGVELGRARKNRKTGGYSETSP